MIWSAKFFVSRSFYKLIILSFQPHTLGKTAPSTLIVSSLSARAVVATIQAQLVTIPYWINKATKLRIEHHTNFYWLPYILIQNLQKFWLTEEHTRTKKCRFSTPKSSSPYWSQWRNRSLHFAFLIRLFLRIDSAFNKTNLFCLRFSLTLCQWTLFFSWTKYALLKNVKITVFVSKSSLSIF